MQTISTLSLSIMESSPTLKCEACCTVNSLCIMHFVYMLKQKIVWPNICVMMVRWNLIYLFPIKICGKYVHQSVPWIWVPSRSLNQSYGISIVKWNSG